MQQLDFFDRPSSGTMPNTIRCMVSRIGGVFVALTVEGPYEIEQGATAQEALSNLKKLIINNAEIPRKDYTVKKNA